MKTSFETAAEAYRYCQEAGILSERVSQVFKAVCSSPRPMNQTMVHQAIIRETGKVGLEKYSVSPRFVILERMGLIREVGKGRCPVTGRTTVFYEPTFEKERMTETEACAKAAQKESLAQLKEENRLLREENAKMRELLDRKTGMFQQREEALRKNPVAVQMEFA